MADILSIFDYVPKRVVRDLPTQPAEVKIMPRKPEPNLLDPPHFGGGADPDGAGWPPSDMLR
jgi:hypothetical protein